MAVSRAACSLWCFLTSNTTLLPGQWSPWAAEQTTFTVKHQLQKGLPWVCAHAGFKDLHSFAFLGGSGRIGTAQDGIYAYVPAGPHKQFDMLLHAYAAYKAGRIKAQPFCLP